ncbi:MAG: sigma-70 family RNA polymerase sigma factor [Opitutaceae bacterium]|nr:sigma-70 family RNA polymerase sigma factor [Opitutaceae bacterium]
MRGAAIDGRRGQPTFRLMPTSAPSSSISRPDPPDGFASTEWSLVLSAADDCGPALDRLCRTYWRPVYVFVRASGSDRHEAEDITQEFFADMLRREWLKRADPGRGSFRAFLRNHLRFFVSNRRRTELAQKRGGGQRALPIDTEAGEQALAKLAAGADPSELFEQNWADCVLQAAVERLATEQDDANQRQRFDRLRPFLTHAPAPGDYASLADELRLSQSAVALLVHRLTRRFADLIRAEVAATLCDRRQLEDELRYLLRLVSPRN